MNIDCIKTNCNWYDKENKECVKGEKFSKLCQEFHYDMFKEPERLGDTRAVYGFHKRHSSTLKGWF